MPWGGGDRLTAPKVSFTSFRAYAVSEESILLKRFFSHFYKDINSPHPSYRHLIPPTGRRKKSAFTLAEVLITLGIIGVVAAMTMPSLIQKYRNNVVETRLQKFYSVMNQAVLKAELEYGDKKEWYEDLGGVQYDSEGNVIEGSSNVDVWFQKYLAPHLTIIKKTINTDGLPTYYFPDGSALAPIDPSESRDWAFYIGSPEKCRIKYNNDMGVCAFAFEFYPASKSPSWQYLYDKGFEPVKYNWDGKESTLYSGSGWSCEKSTSSAIGNRAYCAALIQYNGWKIPKDYPLAIHY